MSTKICLLLILSCMSHNLMAKPQETNKKRIDAILKEVYESDQVHRPKIDSLMKAKAGNNEISNAYIPLINQDKKNREITLPIIDSIILNKIDDLDTLSYKACYLVVQHSSAEIQEKYSEFILYLSQSDYISILEYIWFVDRLNVGFNKAQKYGVQALMSLNGIIMLYPVSDQYMKNWDELGVKFTDKPWKDVNRPPIIISDNEFVIFGVISKQESGNTYTAVEKVEIRIGDSGSTYTDDSGYFYYVVNKTLAPNIIRIMTNDNEAEYEIGDTADKDFVCVRYQL